MKKINNYEPILKELAAGMLETAETKPNFSNDAFIDAVLIFQTVFTDKIFDCMQQDRIYHEEQIKMIQAAGDQLRKLIHTFTGLDTVKLEENYGKE
jgi:hypothetical protein